jgi:hypothetical protein
MTKWAVYDSRGRWALWGMATTNMIWELTDDEDDYLNDLIAVGGWGMATGALMVPELLPRIVGYGVTHAGAPIARVAATVASTVVAPVAVGYAIGATAGTVIASEVFGEEGAQTALGFYSLGTLPGTEAPTLDTYGNLLRPSETDVAGPVEIVQQISQTVKALIRSRPKLPVSPWKRKRTRFWWM